jgi:hypothetical protein
MSTNDKPGGLNARSELRLPHNETLYVELYGAGMGSTDNVLSASLTVTETADVSANGLQVKMKTVLQTGTIHRLCVIRDSTGERFNLIGKVKWQKRLPGSTGYMTGISLFESDETSIAEWKLAVAAMLRDEGGDKACC